MKRLLSTLIITASACFAVEANAQTFTELRGNSGIYMADFGTVSDWTVVGMGTRDTSFCAAYKSELDRSPYSKTEPYGQIGGNIHLSNYETAFILQRETPYSRTTADNPLRLHVTGRYGISNDSYEWRVTGDKFFTPLERDQRYRTQKLSFTDLLQQDNKVLEIKSSSWEYPAINVGFSDDTGLFAVTGLQEVRQLIQTCETALVGEFPSHYADKPKGFATLSTPGSTPADTPVIELPPIPEGWEKTDFGNYMAYKNEWLTFMYRKIKSGRDDAFFLVDMSYFDGLKRDKQLKLEFNKRERKLSTSKYSGRNHGEAQHVFGNLSLTRYDIGTLERDEFVVKAKYRGEKLEFPITGFAGAEEYRKLYMAANPN